MKQLPDEPLKTLQEIKKVVVNSWHSWGNSITLSDSIGSDLRSCAVQRC